MKRSRRHRNPSRGSRIPWGSLLAVGAVSAAAYALYQAGGSFSDALSSLNPMTAISNAASSAEDEASSLVSSVESGISGGVSSIEDGVTGIWNNFTSMFSN